jgi:membrane-associated protein
MLDDIVRQTLGDGSILAYVALFFGIMLENAGIPLPGETALLVAGYLTSEAGGYRLHLWAVIIVACLGAVVGDNLGFWLGRKLARPRLAAGKRFLFLTPARFQQAERYFARYGAATVFFGRWVALLRIAAGPAAGAAGMPWGRFLLANAAGAAVWATGIGLIGHFAGHAWQAIQTWLGRGAWVLAAAVLLAFVAWHLRGLLRRRNGKATHEVSNPETASVPLSPASGEWG